MRSLSKNHCFLRKKKGQIAKSGINIFEIFSNGQAIEIFSSLHPFLIVGATAKSWLTDSKTYNDDFLIYDKNMVIFAIFQIFHDIWQ